MLQKRVFGLLMAIFMVLGMEGYNTFLQHGFSLQIVLGLSWIKAILMLMIVIFMQTYIVGPVTGWLTDRFILGRSFSFSKIRFIRQVLTVCFMCPLMSVVVMFLFKGGFSSQFLQIWLKTVIYNFPMAFCWSIFIAGPSVRYITRYCFEENSTFVI